MTTPGCGIAGIIESPRAVVSPKVGRATNRTAPYTTAMDVPPQLSAPPQRASPPKATPVMAALDAAPDEPVGAIPAEWARCLAEGGDELIIEAGEGRSQTPPSPAALSFVTAQALLLAQMLVNADSSGMCLCRSSPGVLDRVAEFVATKMLYLVEQANLEIAILRRALDILLSLCWLTGDGRFVSRITHSTAMRLRQFAELASQQEMSGFSLADSAGPPEGAAAGGGGAEPTEEPAENLKFGRPASAAFDRGSKKSASAGGGRQGQSAAAVVSLSRSLALPVAVLSTVRV